MRTLGAALLATSLVASSAFAAGNSVAPLSGGKPAGAKEAALFGPASGVILVGIGVVIAGLALTLSNNGNDGVTTPSTTRTGGTLP